ncbi:endospore germination permease [Herbivorax sp. ANBcel31]|uniref:GerAB/ArcD/ProY family transporter n=1 Tax=Herbivorax sp. ANBcel31 TaxID=3069754 RepID=UPI0027B57A1F|nr:endospore germination permease [Herbivorax sp. ANBcel31]MDQ2085456.1 endospore germination permease [Herbivorax sp. ANBcel31]
MDRKIELKEINMLTFVIQTMIGVRLLTLPRDLVSIATNDAWLSVVVAGILSFFLGYSYYWLGIRYKGLNISQIMEQVLGKIIGKIIQIGIALYTLLSVGLSARTFGDSIQLFLLDKTPVTLVILLMIFACVCCVCKGLKTISIIIDILLPFIIFFLFLLLMLSSTNMESKNLLPVLHKGVTPVLEGYIEIVHPFLGLGVIGYVMPYFKEPFKTKKWIFTGVSIVTLFYLAIVMMCIMVFSIHKINELVHPTIILSKTIQLENPLFERAESIFITAWIPITFSTMTLYYYASVLNLKALFDTKKHNLMIYIQIPLLIFIALYPKNVIKAYQYLKINNYLALALVIIALLLPFISILKSKKGGKNV